MRACYRCKRELHEADFHHGMAVQIGSLFSCDACAEPLLARLTPEQRRAIYRKLEATAAAHPPAEDLQPADAPPERPDAKSPLMVAGRAGPATRKAGVPPVVWIAGAGTILLILILILVLAGGTGRPPTEGPGDPAGPGGVARRPDSPPPPARDVPPPPDDTRRREILRADIAALDQEIRARSEKQEYQKALDALASARARHPDLSWTQAVDRLTREIRGAVDGAFIRLRPRLQEADDAGDADRLREYQRDVEKWGIAEYIDEVKRRVESVESRTKTALTLDLGDGVTMEFIRIKPGTFVMGGGGTLQYDYQGVEKPKHTVTITKGFYLGKYEVTQRQYEALMGGNPSKWKAANRPVHQVTWLEAVEFCRRLGARTRRVVRLPTEAEWEYACRAGSSTAWSHGSDTARLGEYAWYDGNSGGRTHEVGKKKPNPWGLYDIHGNVWEWVSDWYDAGYYTSDPKTDPTGPEAGKERLLRGGSWDDYADLCRSAARYRKRPPQRRDYLGFRAAVSLP